jgi:hypothetical protein
MSSVRCCLVYAILCFAPHEVSAQELALERDTIQSLNRLHAVSEARFGLRASIGPNGHCLFSRTTLMTPTIAPKVLEQLRSQLVRNAVDVVEDQDESIRVILQKDREHPDVLLEGRHRTPIERIRRDMRNEVTRILLPYQLDRLKRFETRYGLLVEGVRGMQSKASDQGKNTRVGEACIRLQAEARKQVLEMTASLCEDCRGVLDEAQNEILQPYLALEPILQRLPIEVWIWQLNGKELAAVNDDDSHVLEMLHTGLFFELTPDGALRSTDQLSSALGVDVLLRDIVAAQYTQTDVFAIQILEYVMSAARDDTMVKELERRQREIQRAMLNGEIDLSEAGWRMKRLIADVERWKWNRLESVLLPAQRTTLQLLIEKRAIIQQGWIRAFTSGPLSEKIALSEKQGMQLEHIRRNLYKKLVELSRDLDDQCIRTLRGLVSPHCKKQLISIKELDRGNLPGAPELLVSQRQ